MKHFKEFIQWCCEPQRLFVLFIVVLAIPNVALFFTEQQMTLWARICNVILPVSVYWLIMTLGRKPGKTIWILFPFVFFAAFHNRNHLKMHQLRDRDTKPVKKA